VAWAGPRHRGLGRAAVDVDRDAPRAGRGVEGDHRRWPWSVPRLVGLIDDRDLHAGDGLALELGAVEDAEHRVAHQLLAERRRAQLAPLGGAAAVLVAGGAQREVGRDHRARHRSRCRAAHLARSRRPRARRLDDQAGLAHVAQQRVGLEQQLTDRRAPLVDHAAQVRRRQRPRRVRRREPARGPDRRQPRRDHRLGLVAGGLGQGRQHPDAIERGQRHVLAQLDPLLGLAHQHDRDRRLLVQLHQRGEHAGHAVGADQPGDRLDLIEAEHQRSRRAHAQRAQHLERAGLVGHAVAQVERGQIFVGQLGGAQPVDDRALGVAIGDAAQHLAEIRRQARQRRQASTALVEQRPQLRVLLRQVAERHRELLAADQRLIDAIDHVLVVVLLGVRPHRRRHLAQRVPQQALERAGGGQALHRVARDVRERRRQIFQRRHVDAHVLPVGAPPQVRELVGLAHAGIAGDEHHLRPALAADHRDGLGDRHPRRRVDRRDVGRRQRVGIEPRHRVSERTSVEEHLGERHRYLRAT
jgi:hypothetical protein